jgi:hypothetical protein
MQSTISTISAKVQFNGQFRRFVMQSTSFDALAATIRSIYNISDALEVRVRYLDNEGDEITISSDPELVTALQTSSGKCLKLSVVALQKEIKPVSNSAPVAKAAPVEEKPAQTQVAAKPRHGMPDFVRELIKQKQADKKEKALRKREEKSLDDSPVNSDEKPARSDHRARLLDPRDGPDCSGEFVSDSLFTKSWKLRNAGPLPWSTEFKLIRVTKDTSGMCLTDSVAITRDVAPNEEYQVTVPMRAPSQPGTYECFWRMTDQEGKKFGPRLTYKITVLAKPVQVQPVVEQQQQVLADNAAVFDRKQFILARRQTREERLKKYETQLVKLQELGYKTNNQHLRLLAENDGDVDRVVAFLAQKKTRAHAQS